MALCASWAEKTNRFPWKEIVFRLHLRGPHKADQSCVCCVEQEEEEEEEERIWAATLSHTHTDTRSDNVTQREDLGRSVSSARGTRRDAQASDSLLVQDKMCDCVVFLTAADLMWPSGLCPGLAPCCWSTGRAALWWAGRLRDGRTDGRA